MNLPLADPSLLAQDIPDLLTARLRVSGQAICLRFSHRGDLLATGTLKGTISIFDLETNGIARKLQGHTGRAIQSLSWEKTGRFLLSSSVDWKVIIWDLKDGSKARTVNLGAPVYIAEFHPSDHLMICAALYEHRPVLADLRSPTKAVQHPLPNLPKRAPHEQESEKADAKHFTTVAAFTPDGTHIITGTTKGWLSIVSVETKRTIYSTRLSSKPILLIRLSATGNSLLINSSDTIIRTIRLPDLRTANPDSINLEVEHKFQDVVNRLSWNYVAFSPGRADYVTASTLMNHDVYIWERGHGSLVKILEGPREELGSVEWHPSRPIVAATGVESGRVYLWGVVAPQRWSALAPDFVEVEENVEFVEREDEFDILPLGEVEKRRLEEEEAEEVDVLTVDPDQLQREGGVKGESQGPAPGFFRLPVLLDGEDSDSEDEMVAIGAGQYRRKSTAREEGLDFDEERGEDSAADSAGVGGGSGRKRRREG
ncbi:hypothetical protein MBLNU230_g5413t1 [Neophaeotheca triangularis]